MNDAILLVFGTRPEAVKLAPLARAFSSLYPALPLRVCVTGQHRQMLDQVLAAFELRPDWDLALMEPNQDLAELTAKVLLGVRSVIRAQRPRLLVVQGDTSTAFCASLAAFYEGVEVAHVEAGLRTDNPLAPWPEEMNRRLISCLARYHFAPTELARRNLIREGVDDSKIFVTGNTVIDALTFTVRICRSDPVRGQLQRRFAFLDQSKRVILVTGHRRESFGAPLRAVCMALARLARRDDVQVVYPVHMNPRVRGPVAEMLGQMSNIHLIEPLGYTEFVGLMDRSYMIITDSGGIQEEAPALGKPVLVTRETTERREALDAGVARLVGIDEQQIVAEAERLLDMEGEYLAMARAVHPFGDGHAAERIANVIAHSGLEGRP